MIKLEKNDVNRNIQQAGKNIFLCSSKIESSKSLKIIIESAKKKEEKITNKELLIEVQKIRKKTKFVALLFALRFFILGNLFGSKVLSVSYKNIPVGKYAVSTSYRNPKSYQKKYFYYALLVKNIAAGIARLISLNEIRGNVVCCYVNDPAYLNGLYAEWGAKNSIPIYHNKYPYRLSRFQFMDKRDFSEALLVQPRSQYDTEMIEMGEEEIKKRVSSTESIEYMQDASFSEGFDGGSEAEALIYCHSFTDAQQDFGGDKTFLNMLEWLEYTVEKLGNKKIIIKAHPSFYKEGYKTSIFEYDRIIFERFKDKILSRSNIRLIDWSVRNRDVLENLNKECILISHHGNALLEGAYLGFRCVSANAAPWKKYNLFNEWHSLSEYEQILSDFEELKSTESIKLFEFMFDLGCSENSFFSSKSWRVTAAKMIGEDPRAISRDSSVLKGLNDSDFDKLTDQVSDEIGEIIL